MRKYVFWVLILLSATFYLSSCEKEIEIDLPEYENQLVVECYLEAGLPYILSLTESVGFLDPFEVPVVKDATVTITHKGVTDTLTLIDSLNVYVKLDKIVAANDFEPYYLEVKDDKGRTVSSTTQMMPRTDIDTLIYLKNDSAEASVIMYFYDLPEATNYYKVYFTNANTFDPDSTYSWEFSDNVFADQRTVSGTGYAFREGDDVEVRLYTIDEAYYRFLETVDDAGDATASPFSRPSRIISNIEGGTGIFTAVDYDLKALRIE